jgi:integrase
VVGVAQLVRAPDCGSGGRGFETRHPPHKTTHDKQRAILFQNASRIVDGTSTVYGDAVKERGSKRRVPIYSSLIQQGFMQYLESIKQAGHTRLFPQLKSKGNNGYGDPVGKWFGRLVSSLGLTDPRLVIHSLRHGGISKLHSAGVPVNIAETLTGHTAGKCA